MAKVKSGKTGTKPTEPPKQPKAKPKVCETCFFMSLEGGKTYQTYFCHRNPMNITVSLQHWCGEWRTK